MIKKLIFSFVAFLVILPSHAVAQSPSPTPTNGPVDSYTLFWPIVAGKVRGDGLYFLKSLKEQIRETLIFGDFKKADYNITLSVKRVVETEKLFLVNKDYDNAARTLGDAQTSREKALNYIDKAASQGKNVTDLKNTLASSLEKQRALLLYIQGQLPDEQKEIITKNVESLNTLLTKLQ